MDHARFADRDAHGVIDVRHGAEALDAISGEGFWAVVASFEGDITAVRFAEDGRCADLREAWVFEPGDHAPHDGWGT